MSPLWLVDKFTYLGSSVSSTETDINTRLAKTWTAIDRLSVTWKSDLTNKMKGNFFPSSGCVDTLWTQTKRMEKKLAGYSTRMLRAILNRSWRQHPTKQQLYGHLPPITKIIQVRWTRHAEHCWRSRNEFISDLCGPLHMDEQKQEDQLEPTYNSSVPIQDVALKICREQWTIEKGSEKGSGKSVLTARHNDDDANLAR